MKHERYRCDGVEDFVTEKEIIGMMKERDRNIKKLAVYAIENKFSRDNVAVLEIV